MGVNNMIKKIFIAVQIIVLNIISRAQTNETYFNNPMESESPLNKTYVGVHCLDRLYFLEKRKALIGDSYSGLTIWSYEDNSCEDLIKWRSNESTSHVALSQDEQNIVATSYIGKKSDLSPIIGCYNFLQKRWLWKFDLKEHLGGTYIRKIFFLENTDLLIVLLRDDICYLDVPTGKILKRNVSIVGEYENRGEVIISYLRTSRSGRYFAIWNQFTGGGMLPACFYSKGKKYVIVWDVVAEKEVVRFDKPGGKIDDLAFSDDEKNLVITSYDNKIKLWSITENKLLLEQDGWAPFIRTSKNKIVLSDGESICVLKYPSFEIEKSFGVLEISRTPKVYPIAISTDGDLLAFEKDARIYLYDTKRWGEIYNVWTCRKKIIEY